MGKGLGILLIIIGVLIALIFGAVLAIAFSRVAAGTHYIANWGILIFYIFLFIGGIALIILGIRSAKK